ncbi:MAG: DUF4835 family protein [Cytophagaceae bacterium]|nr:DUF4835 family protein [Cytophagaceae bacterium]
MKLILARFLFYMLPVLAPFMLSAQDVECTVTIDNQQATDIPKNLIEDLKQNIQNFINNRRWTEDNFEPFERVKFNLSLTFERGASIGNYPSRATIQVVRPIYGTTYESVSFMFLDEDFDFEFQLGTQLLYNENNFESRLTSLLAFYTYVVLAIDYDSFSKLGGSKYVEKAFNIAGIAQQNVNQGWEVGNFSNKWALINQLNNQQFSPFREMLYQYHYQALDRFLTDRSQAQKTILTSLKKIEGILTFFNNSIVIRSFFLAKYNELINIYGSADPATKSEVVKLLTKLDITNSDKYRAIQK